MPPFIRFWAAGVSQREEGGSPRRRAGAGRGGSGPPGSLRDRARGTGLRFRAAEPAAEQARRAPGQRQGVLLAWREELGAKGTPG